MRILVIGFVWRTEELEATKEFVGFPDFPDWICPGSILLKGKAL